MAKKFENITRKADALPAEEREALERRLAAELEAEVSDYERSLTELRKATALTQVQLAAALGVSQAQVSRIENQTDLYLSTLASYIAAMGGELVLSASFAGGTLVPLTVGESKRRERVTA